MIQEFLTLDEAAERLKDRGYDRDAVQKVVAEGGCPYHVRDLTILIPFPEADPFFLPLDKAEPVPPAEPAPAPETPPDPAPESGQAPEPPAAPEAPAAPPESAPTTTNPAPKAGKGKKGK